MSVGKFCFPLLHTFFLPEPPCYIVVSLLLFRIREYFLRCVIFDEFSHVEKARHVRYARGLLHIVRYDDDGDFLLEVDDQLFYFGR